MNAITLHNPSPLVLFYVALAHAIEDGAIPPISREDLEAHIQSARSRAPAPATAENTSTPELKPIRKPADLLRLEPGDLIHWKGARFEFDGEVVEVNVDEGHFDEDDSLIYDDEESVLYVRRSDTGKRVSLTWADLQTHSLTLR